MLPAFVCTAKLRTAMYDIDACEDDTDRRDR